MRNRLLCGLIISTMMAASACSKSDDAATGTGTSAGGGDTVSSYKTKHLPSTFMVEIPESLRNGANAVRVKREKQGLRRAIGPVATVDYSSQSQGYSQLVGLVGQIEGRILNLTMQFLFVDVAFETVSAQCGTSSCNIAEGEISLTMTTEMATKIIEMSNLEGEAATAITEMVGESVPLPAFAYTNLGGDGGFDHQIVSSYGGDNAYGSSSTLFAWATDQSKVKLVDTYVYGEITGSQTFIYDDTKKLMTVRDEYTSGADKYNSSFSVEPITGDDQGGVKISSTMSSTGTTSYRQTVEGIAANDGGYIESNYTYEMTTVDATGLTEDGTYLIAPAGVSATEVSWETAVGTVSVYGGTATVSYWGPEGEIATAQVFLPTYDEEYNPTGGTLVDGASLSDSGTETYAYWYREAFDGNGDLTAWSYKDSADGEWVTMSGDFSDVAYDDEYATADYEVSMPTVTVSGASDVEAELVIVPSGVTPDGSNWDQVIGYGYVMYADDGTFAHQISYWGTEDQAASAAVYSRTWDYETGVEVYTAISGAVVSYSE